MLGLAQGSCAQTAKRKRASESVRNRVVRDDGRGAAVCSSSACVLSNISGAMSQILTTGLALDMTTRARSAGRAVAEPRNGSSPRHDGRGGARESSMAERAQSAVAAAPSQIYFSLAPATQELERILKLQCSDSGTATAIECAPLRTHQPVRFCPRRKLLSAHE